MSTGVEESKANQHGPMEFNPITLYQAGQDTVQDIIQNAQEIFQVFSLIFSFDLIYHVYAVNIGTD